MSRLRVVVLFGGKSVEREVSRISARTIVGALDPSKYDVLPLAVGEDGRFLSAGASAKLLSEGHVPERYLASKAAPVSEALVPAEIGPGRTDVVFPIIHGTTGEDGALQGFLEILGLPYVGAGVTGSAVGMDKEIFKALLEEAGLPSARSVCIPASERGKLGPLLAELRYPLPVFVKPACGGSSVGITKVKRREDVDAALDVAWLYDDRALIEEGIDARELECAVLGNDDPRASIVGEIVPGHEFYDYDDKYRDTKAKLLIPADVPAAVAEEVRRLALEVFALCGLSGMARVDFFLERGSGRVLFNELNTLPGFTSISMYPKLWEASGLPLPKLLDELIRLALERKERRDRLSRKPPAELT
ncbi:MAG TPA: D-alanine--D-alanine ligase family protein [Thermoanaerobaculia bacterium]|nr:D-alanine--D-alanine ligase family protein [Thermoanaerobaculia bacterium]